jgi:ribonucleotide monophosphatase NagD (HAD superfamily)
VQPRLCFSNPDFLYAGEYDKPRFGQGAFRVTLMALWKELTGLDLAYEQFGKPSAATYGFATQALQQQAARLALEKGNDAPPLTAIYGIGDNPTADIRGANGARARGDGGTGVWRSILLETGVFKRGDTLPESDKPMHLVPGVKDAVDFVFDSHAV